MEQDWLSVMEEYNAFQAFVSNKKWNKKKLRIVKDIYNEISFDYKNHEIRSWKNLVGIVILIVQNLTGGR